MKTKIKLLASSSFAISIAIFGPTSVMSMDPPEVREHVRHAPKPAASPDTLEMMREIQLNMREMQLDVREMQLKIEAQNNNRSRIEPERNRPASKVKQSLNDDEIISIPNFAVGLAQEEERLHDLAYGEHNNRSSIGSGRNFREQNTKGTNLKICGLPLHSKQTKEHIVSDNFGNERINKETKHNMCMGLVQRRRGTSISGNNHSDYYIQSKKTHNTLLGLDVCKTKSKNTYGYDDYGNPIRIQQNRYTMGGGLLQHKSHKETPQDEVSYAVM